MNEELSNDLQLPDEKSVLLQQAKVMGLSVSNNIGLETLKEKIRAHLEETSAKDEPAEPETPVADKPKTLREVMYQEQMKLVRIRIVNLDPKKASLKGEVFTVANEYIGTVRKFIPYDPEVSENGYHVPYCIYTQLVEKKFLSIRVTTVNGKEHVSHAWAKEFGIEVLPPLTPEELRQLAQAQLAAGSID